jgi:hypothetical protein
MVKWLRFARARKRVFVSMAVEKARDWLEGSREMRSKGLEGLRRLWLGLY